MKGICRKGHRIAGANGYITPSSGIARCMKCKKEYNNAWIKEVREQGNPKYTNYGYRPEKETGWTIHSYLAAKTKQDNKCAICGKTEGAKKLQPDHNHKTGKPRELLCRNCNCGLGLFRDDLGLLKKAERYLQKHNAQ
jgi:DNA-directed RNA polymerase subunit RPC12/RpoP